MNNFAEFIQKDIAAKKQLITSLPSKTKAQKKKLMDVLKDARKKYAGYENLLRTYMMAKSDKYDLPELERETATIKEEINDLLDVKFLLDEKNTAIEDLGLDAIGFEMGTVEKSTFEAVNNLICEFFSIFEAAEVELTAADFGINWYVYTYMKTFIDCRRGNDFTRALEVYGKMFWADPKLVDHIRLAFVILSFKYIKKLSKYRDKLNQEELKRVNKNNLNEVLIELNECYLDLEFDLRDTINDVLKMSKEGVINITQFEADSKILSAAMESFKLTDISDRTYEILLRLKSNIQEYNNYVKFKDFINAEIEILSKVVEDPKLKEKNQEAIKNNEKEIKELMKELNKVNSFMGLGTFGFLTKSKESDMINSEFDHKNEKLQSIALSNKLFVKYMNYANLYFDKEIIKSLNDSMSVEDLIDLLACFPYFKKVRLSQVYNLKDYQSIMDKVDEFDEYACNTTNAVSRSILLFHQNNIAGNLIARYKIDGLDLSPDDLAEENLEETIRKIDTLLRYYIIKHNENELDVEKIWFVSEVYKVKKAIEEKEKAEQKTE